MSLPAVLPRPWGLTRLTGVAARAVRGAVAKVLAPHKAALRNLADIPLTCAGVAGIDFAAFHISHGWGWLATGLSLLVVEHMIADE